MLDAGRIASKSHEYNTGFTPWGRKLSAKTKLPSPQKVVGWVFLVPGVGLPLLAAISLIAA